MRITEPYTIFQRKLPSGRIVWYYQYRNEDGTRSNAYSLATDKKSVAIRTARDLYRSGKMYQSAKSRLFFREFIKDFFSENSDYCKWRELVNRKLTPATRYRYENCVKFQLLPFFEKISINEITSAMIKEWIIWASEKWKPKSINSAKGVLNIILDSATEKNLLQKNPMSSVKLLKVEKKHRDLLTIDEIKLIVNSEWNNKEQCQMVLLAVITGMRMGEISALQFSDIHENYLSVTKSYNRQFGMGETKTHLKRQVPMPDNFFCDIKKIGYVFQQENGKPIAPATVYATFARLCDKLNIDRKARGITIHSLRNFFISYMQSENVTESKIRAVVGHADTTMTDLYTYWKPEMMPEIYEAQSKLMQKITEK